MDNLDFKPENLRVIIPVGGLAKRLMPLTAETSKACVRLVNMPLISIAILGLARQGVRHFIFGVKGYRNYKDLFDLFGEGFGFSAKYGIHPRLHIKYQPNVEDYGSADSVRINVGYYDVRDPVFGVQGDNIFDLDLQELLDYHRERGGIATICLKRVGDVEGYGIAEVDEEMRIQRFVEKPSREEVPSNLANTGLYLFSPQIREVMESSEVQEIMARRGRLDFGYDFIPHLLETGHEVYGYIIEKGWYDVGSPERYLEAMYDLLRGRLEFLSDFGGRISVDERIWIQGESPESLARRREIIEMIRAGKIEVEEPVLIGRHCQIGEGVKISNSCIDNYTIIGEGAVIRDSAIMDRVRIGEGAEVSDSIIGRHTTVNSTHIQPTRISSVSAVGDDVQVDAGSILEKARIYPHLRLTRGEYRGEIRKT
ncbi:MAG: NDP-sugar synthase [Candidatus Bathyarchaeia archaeon]|nr:NDP-sugar synthase [Candidatus Bathyarchaeota archaeon]